MAEFYTGREAVLTVKCKQHTVTVKGQQVDKALKQPITKENIVKQLSKLGDTVFSPEDIEVKVSNDSFYPLKEINELRRRAILSLEEVLVKEHRLNFENRCRLPYKAIEAQEKTVKQNTYFSLSFETIEQFHKILNSDLFQNISNVLRVYVAWDLYLQHQDDIDCFCKKYSERVEWIIALPYIVRRDFIPRLDILIEKSKYSKFHGFLVRNIEEIAYLLKAEFSGKIYTDFGVYLWNRHALFTVKEMIDGFTLPLELKGTEQHQLIRINHQSNPLKTEKMIYGYMPMMVTANCVAKTKGKCKTKGKSIYYLKDRYDKIFPVVANCENCKNIVYNSVPMSLHKELNKWQDCDSLRIAFTVENADDAYAIFQYYTQESFGDFPISEYTTGHNKRGVE